jgi:tetratricopeptide (TPR) repeat protein
MKATLAIKENRFSDAIKILEIALNIHPNHIDCLYLSAVSCRYLKDLEKSKEFVHRLLVEAPDMGRAYQELGHINREAGNDQQATQNYRQACELNSALIGSWNGFIRSFY